jgi:hypothetical protein
VYQHCYKIIKEKDKVSQNHSICSHYLTRTFLGNESLDLRMVYMCYLRFSVNFSIKKSTVANKSCDCGAWWISTKEKYIQSEVVDQSVDEIWYLTDFKSMFSQSKNLFGSILLCK